MTDDNTLLAEYEYLADEHRHHNWLIHATWYLTIILIAGALRYYTTNDSSPQINILIALFGLAVFGGLGVYSFFQIERRDEVKWRKQLLEKELGFALRSKEHENRDIWKALLLLSAFYLTPFILSGIWGVINLVLWL